MRPVGRPKCTPGDETVTFAMPRAVIDRLTELARQEIMGERHSAAEADRKEAPHCNREPTPYEINRRARALMTRALTKAFPGPRCSADGAAPSRPTGVG